MASQGYRIERVEDFNLFMPALEGLDEVKNIFNTVQQQNRDFLARCSYPDLTACKSITGSFITAHAPDYVGVHTLDWDENRWSELFQSMKHDQIDTVVLQASLWHELGECYYRTERFAGEYRSWNVVEPMLKAARANDMTVFLGCYGSVAGWKEGREGLEASRLEIIRQLDCLQELLQWRDYFDGLYFTPETAFRGIRNPETESMLNLLYRNFFGRVREMAPDKKLLISPGSKYFPGADDDFLAFWTSVFDKALPDIIAPQDSVGCCGCTLENLPDMWKLWKKLTDQLNITLWSNVELFERTEFGGPAPFRRADENRIARQVAVESVYAQKLICWEYPTFGKFPLEKN